MVKGTILKIVNRASFLIIYSKRQINTRFQSTISYMSQFYNVMSHQFVYICNKVAMDSRSKMSHLESFSNVWKPEIKIIKCEFRDQVSLIKKNAIVVFLI